MAPTERIVIVGSGPAGISVCRPLAEAGFPILWLDAGLMPPPRPEDAPQRLKSARMGDRSLADALLGPNFSALRPADRKSPRLRLAVNDEFFDGFESSNVATCRDFAPIGAHAVGGLARVWGAFAPAYDDNDLGHGAIRAGDLQDSYRRVAGYIGLSGDADGPLADWLGSGMRMQPPLGLSPIFERVWDKARRVKNSEIMIDRARLAVLSQDRGERRACSQCGACHWGCGRGAIWDGGEDIARICALPNVEMKWGIEVERLNRQGALTRLWCRDRSANVRFEIESKFVLIAAGVLASTRLILAVRGQVGVPVTLQTAPAVAMAFVAPWRIGAPVSSDLHGLAQLCFRQTLEDGDYLFGMLHDASAVPAPDIAAALPVSRRGGLIAVRNLMAALAIGFAYFPGRFSDHRIKVVIQDNVPRLEISGGVSPELRKQVKNSTAKLGRAFSRIGLRLIPRSIQLVPNGAECHYGSTLPAGHATSAFGEVNGHPGLYVVDGSILPRMSAKHHTFTVMANADRIGRWLAAERLKAGLNPLQHAV